MKCEFIGQPIDWDKLEALPSHHLVGRIPLGTAQPAVADGLLDGVESRCVAHLRDELALLYERERQRGNTDRATLAVARKMVAHMQAVERRNTDFVPAGEFKRTAAT
jgi:hypothetical protein